GNEFVMGEQRLLVPEGKLAVLKENGFADKDVILGVRPEDIHDEPLFLDHSPHTKIKAPIEVAELMGSEIMLYSQVNGESFVARVDARFNVQAGQTIDMAMDLNKAHFFDPSTELRIK